MSIYRFMAQIVPLETSRRRDRHSIRKRRMARRPTYNTDTATSLAKSEYQGDWNNEECPVEAELFGGLLWQNSNAETAKPRSRKRKRLRVARTPVLAMARMRPWGGPASAPDIHYAPAENLEHVALIDAPSMKSIWCYLFLPRSSVEGASPASPAPGECFDSASSRSKSAKTSAMSVARLGSSAAGVCANRIRR
jgi:hypothetical protein